MSSIARTKVVKLLLSKVEICPALALHPDVRIFLFRAIMANFCDVRQMHGDLDDLQVLACFLKS